MKLSPTRGLKPGKDSFSGTKRLRTPAGTLTAKRQADYKFSRHLRPSPITFTKSNSNLPRDIGLEPLQLPSRESCQSSAEFNFSEFGSHRKLGNTERHERQIDPSTYAWLENSVNSLKPGNYKLCLSSTPCSGRTKCLEQWTKERRITLPLDFTTFIEVKHCKRDKDYLYQVKQIIACMEEEISRHIAMLQDKAEVGLTDTELQSLALLRHCKERIEAGTVFRTGERLTTQVRLILESVSSFFTLLFVLDGIDTFTDRDAEGSNMDDVQDYLTSFPLDARLVLSVNKNYELVETWKGNGWHLLDLPTTLDPRRKRKMLDDNLRGMPVVYQNTLIDTMEGSLSLPTTIDLVAKHVKHAVNCHCRPIELQAKGGGCDELGKEKVASTGGYLKSGFIDTLKDHMIFAAEISDYLKFIFQRHGLRGIMELTYERLEDEYSERSNPDAHSSSFVFLMANMLMYQAPLLISNAVLSSGMPEHSIMALVRGSPALFRSVVSSETDARQIMFTTSEARTVAMRRYFGTFTELHQAQAMYIRDAKYGASSLTFHNITNVPGTFTEKFGQSLVIGKIVALHNAAALQAHRRNAALAFSMATRALKLCTDSDNVIAKVSVSGRLLGTLTVKLQTAVKLLEGSMKTSDAATPNSKMLRPPTHQRSRLYTREELQQEAQSEQDDPITVGTRQTLPSSGPETLVKLLQNLVNEPVLKKLEAEFIHQSENSLQSMKKAKQNLANRIRKAPRLKGVKESADNRHVKKLKAATVKETIEFNWYRLSRSQFKAALGAVFARNVLSSQDANTLFDAMDWKPSNGISAGGNNGYITWKNFVDLLANVPSVKAGACVWKKSDDDNPLGEGQIAKRHKRYRTVLSKLIVVGKTGSYLGLTENGDVQVYDQKTKKIKQRINFNQKGLRASDICYMTASRVCAIAVRKEDAPAFSGIYFYEPLVDWEKAEVEIKFEGRDSPPTSLAVFTGSLPAPTPSGQTTETKTLMMIGTRDGFVRFGTLDDFVYDASKTLTLRPNGCTSTITCIDYIAEAQSVVCGSMDGKVYLIPFTLLGNIVNGLEFYHDKRTVRVFRNHSRPVFSFQYLSESHSIVSAGLDEAILVWRIRDFKVISYIKTGVSSKQAIAMENTGQVVSLDATVQMRNGQYHQGVHVWNLFGGTEMQVMELTGQVPIAPLVNGAPILLANIKGACGSLTYDQGNNDFILGSHTLRQIVKVPVFCPTEQATHKGDIIEACFVGEDFESNDDERVGSSLRVVSVDHLAAVRLWNPEDGTIFSSFSAASPISSQGVLATAAACDYTGQQLFVGYSDGNIASWRLLKGTMLMLFKGDKRGIDAVSVARQSEMLCASVEGGGVIVWSILDIPTPPAKGPDVHGVGKNEFIAAQNVIPHHTTIPALASAYIGKKKLVIGGDTGSTVSLWRPRGKSCFNEINSQWYNGSNRPTESVSTVGVCLLNSFTVKEERPYFAAVGKDGYLFIYCKSILFGTQLLAQRFSGGSSQETIGCSCCSSGTAWKSVQSPSSKTKTTVPLEYIAVGDRGGGIHIWRIEMKTFDKTESDSPLTSIAVTNVAYWNGFKNDAADGNNSGTVEVLSIALGDACQYVVAAGSDKTVRLYSIRGALIGIFGQSREWTLRSTVSYLSRSGDRPKTSYPAKVAWSPRGRHHAMLSGDVDGAGDAFNFSRESSRWKMAPKRFLENTIHAINAINEGTIGGDDINTEKGSELLRRFSMQTISPSLITKNLYVRRPLPKSPRDEDKTSIAEMLPRTPMQTFKHMKLHVKEKAIGEGEESPS